MANLGKKILSAFVEVSDDKKTDAPKPVEASQIRQVVELYLRAIAETTLLLHIAYELIQLLTKFFA